MAVKNIATIKAMRGEVLQIDLGQTEIGTLMAEMKRDPSDSTSRQFTILDNRFLYLDANSTSDYTFNGLLVEKVAGKWYFDVEQIIDPLKPEEKQTIYRGTIWFHEDVTNYVPYELNNTYLGLKDTEDSFAVAGQMPVINDLKTKLVWQTPILSNDVYDIVKANEVGATYFWANEAERLAETGMSAGEKGLQVDTGTLYEYSGTEWIETGAIEDTTTPQNVGFPQCTIGETTGQFATFALAKAAGYERMLMIEDVHEVEVTACSGREFVWGIGKENVTWYMEGDGKLTGAIQEIRGVNIEVFGNFRFAFQEIKNLNTSSVKIDATTALNTSLATSCNIRDCDIYPNDNDKCIIFSGSGVIRDSRVYSGGATANNIIVGEIDLYNVDFIGEFNNSVFGNIAVNNATDITADGAISLMVNEKAENVVFDKVANSLLLTTSSGSNVELNKCVSNTIMVSGNPTGISVLKNCDTTILVPLDCKTYVSESQITDLFDVGYDNWSFEDTTFTNGVRVYTASGTVDNTVFKNCVCGASGGSSATIELTTSANLTNIKDCVVETDIVDNGIDSEYTYKEFDGTGKNKINNDVALDSLTHGSSDRLVAVTQEGVLSLAPETLFSRVFFECTVGIGGDYANFALAKVAGKNRMLLVGNAVETEATITTSGDEIVWGATKDLVWDVDIASFSNGVGEVKNLTLQVGGAARRVFQTIKLFSDCVVEAKATIADNVVVVENANIERCDVTCGAAVYFNFAGSSTYPFTGIIDGCVFRRGTGSAKEVIYGLDGSSLLNSRFVGNFNVSIFCSIEVMDNVSCDTVGAISFNVLQKASNAINFNQIILTKAFSSITNSQINAVTVAGEDGIRNFSYSTFGFSASSDFTASTFTGCVFSTPAVFSSPHCKFLGCTFQGAVSGTLLYLARFDNCTFEKTLVLGRRHCKVIGCTFGEWGGVNSYTLTLNSTATNNTVIGCNSEVAIIEQGTGNVIEHNTLF